MKHEDERLGAQRGDEEFEDEDDAEEQASAERLYAKIDAQREDARARRVHPVAKGNVVDAAFTITASDLDDAMKATRLRGSKATREMMIVGSILRVTMPLGDVRFSFDVPISDVYVKSGKDTSDSFKIKAGLDRGSRKKNLARDNERLYFVLKLAQHYAELRWHAAPPIIMRRRDRRPKTAPSTRIELDGDGVLRLKARRVRTPPLPLQKDSNAITFDPRQLAGLMQHATAVLKGVEKNVLDDPRTPLMVRGGEISAMQPRSFCVASSPYLEGLDFAVLPKDGQKIALALRRCRGVATLVRQDGRLHVMSGAAKISFRVVPHGLSVEDLVSRAGASLASATFDVGAVLARVWQTNYMVQPRAKPGEVYLNVGLGEREMKLHAESSRSRGRTSAHLSVAIEGFQKSVEGDAYRPLRAIDGNVFERVLESLTDQRAEVSFLETPIISISSAIDSGQGKVTAYLFAPEGEVALL